MFASGRDRHGRVIRAAALVCLTLIVGMSVAPAAFARAPFIYGFGDPDDERAPEPNISNTHGTENPTVDPWWGRSVIWIILKTYFSGGFCYVCFR